MAELNELDGLDSVIETPISECAIDQADHAEYVDPIDHTYDVPAIPTQRGPR